MTITAATQCNVISQNEFAMKVTSLICTDGWFLRLQLDFCSCVCVFLLVCFVHACLLSGALVAHYQSVEYSRCIKLG